MFGLAKPQRAKEMDAIIRPGVLPFGGVNFLDTYEGMPANDAITMINARPTTRGVSVRDGYRVYADTLPGSAAVKTLMSYLPSSVTSWPSSLFNGYIFAATNGDIYDVTDGGSGPWSGMLPATVSDDMWGWLNFQNAGGNYLLACNHSGGYYWLKETDVTAFTKVAAGAGAGQINGVDPDTFVDLTVWKRRVWFIEENSTSAWYLPVEQITGTVAEWDFGPQFRHGGYLAALVSWTIDGGEGIDDYLVAVSSEGDVVIYKGYDPDTADSDPAAFQLHGIWYVGSLPHGRRAVKSIGGDVHIISTQGVMQVSKLVDLANLDVNSRSFISAKINPFISDLMKSKAASAGWYIEEIPAHNYVFVGTPEAKSGEGVRQVVLATKHRAWCLFQDLPMSCVLDNDNYAFGGCVTGGEVYLLFDDYFDGVAIDGSGGEGILARITPAYTFLDLPGMYKLVSMVRPTLVYRYTPSLSAKILTDFKSSAFASVASLSPQTGSRWNAAYWNAARWFGILTPVRNWIGVNGAGYSVTVQFDLEAAGGTELVSLDWWLRRGGPL